MAQLAIDGPSRLSGAGITRTFGQTRDRSGGIRKVRLRRNLNRIGQWRSGIKGTGIGKDQGRCEHLSRTAQLNRCRRCGRRSRRGRNRGGSRALIRRVLPVDRRDLVFVDGIVANIQIGEIIVADTRADQRKIGSVDAAIDIEAVEVEVERRVPSEQCLAVADRRIEGKRRRGRGGIGFGQGCKTKCVALGRWVIGSVYRTDDIIVSRRRLQIGQRHLVRGQVLAIADCKVK